MERYTAQILRRSGEHSLSESFDLMWRREPESKPLNLQVPDCADADERV